MSIEKRLLGAALTMIIFFVLLYLLTSCTTAGQLTEPHPRDYKIIWCDQQFVWVVDYEGDTLKIHNRGKETMFVGDYLIECDQFRGIYNYN